MVSVAIIPITYYSTHSDRWLPTAIDRIDIVFVDIFSSFSTLQINQFLIPPYAVTTRCTLVRPTPLAVPTWTGTATTAAKNALRMIKKDSFILIELQWIRRVLVLSMSTLAV